MRGKGLSRELLINGRGEQEKWRGRPAIHSAMSKSTVRSGA